MKKSVVAIALSAMMLVGAGLAFPRNAYAQTFSGDESAAFLAKVQELKVETHLIQQDISNQTLVAWHIDKTGEFWNANDTKEMAERNQRLSEEIPGALSNLTAAANTTNPDAAKVKSIVDALDNSLAEAVSARIDKAVLDNATVNALVITAILDETMEDYGIALGAEEEDEDESGGNDNITSQNDNMSSSSGNMTAMDNNNNSTSSSTNGTAVTIVNFAAYQTAQGLAAAAQDMFNDLKPKAPASAASAIADLDQGFTKLRQAIDDKMSNDDIMAIVHGTIQPNLESAFNLTPESGEEEEQGNSGGGSISNATSNTANMSKSLIMYATQTSEKIHSDHRSGNAPITGAYEADTKYALNATGNATSMSDASKTEDAKFALNLETWKSTERLVSMDIMGGSVTIGQDTMTVKSGQAYYLVNGHSFFAFALVTPEGNNDNSSIQLIRLRATLPADDNKLPVASTDQPLNLDVQSPPSKIASEWALEMSGQIALSS